MEESEKSVEGTRDKAQGTSKIQEPRSKVQRKSFKLHVANSREAQGTMEYLIWATPPIRM